MGSQLRFDKAEFQPDVYRGSASNGHAVILMSDSWSSQRVMAAPQLWRAGLIAECDMNPGLLGVGIKLKTQQVHGLKRIGLEPISHGWTHLNPTLLSDADLAIHLEDSRQWLLDEGFTKGARHYAAPYQMDKRVSDAAIAAGYQTTMDHDLSAVCVLPPGFTYAIQDADNRYTLSTVQTAIDTLTGEAAKVLFLIFHHFVSSGATGVMTNMQRLHDVIRYIKKSEVRAATHSTLLDP